MNGLPDFLSGRDAPIAAGLKRVAHAAARAAAKHDATGKALAMAGGGVM